MISLKCPYHCEEKENAYFSLIKKGSSFKAKCTHCNLTEVAVAAIGTPIVPVEEPEEEEIELEAEMHTLTAQVNLYNDNGGKRLVINPRELVQCTGQVKGELSEVTYINTLGVIYTGWIETVFLEPFVNNGEIVKVASPTVYQGDAAQYLIYLGVKQYNLCGEFSVLYCAGWTEEPIEDWIDEWKTKDLTGWNLVFRNKYSRTTGFTDLESMFATFEGYPEKFERLTDSFYLPERKRPHLTPFRLREFLKDNLAIIGCKISTYTGRLQASGTLHWVVVESMSPYRHGGLVTIYNPFSNAMEEYSWEEFYASVTGTPYGLAVPRR